MDSIKKEVVFRDPELFKNIGITMNQYRKVGKFCDFELRLECSGTVIKVHKEKLPFESFKKNVYEFILRSADVVLDGASFLDLTMEEIGILISDDKIACSEEKVFTFVMKWLNHDLENRKKFLKNLVEHIRFPLLTDKFIRNEVLTDELLLQTKTILKITFKILESKLSTNDISCLKFDKANSTRVGFCKKNLVFLVGKTIYHSDLENDIAYEKISIEHSPAKITTFAKNFLLLSGGDNSKSCSFYCPQRQFVKPFPPLSENRKFHGIITLNDKIYCCGGCYTPSPVEIFDLGAGTWSKGVNANSGRYDFGISTWDNNCIFVLGGCDLNGKLNHTVEQYDQREDKWTFLPKMEVTSNCTRSCTFNNALYAFTDTTGYIFDIRANKWMEQSTASPPAPLKFFDLTTIEEKVYVLNEDMEYYQTYTDIINNSWEEFELEDMAELDSISVTTMFT